MDADGWHGDQCELRHQPGDDLPGGDALRPGRPGDEPVYPDGDAIGTTGDPWRYDGAGRLSSIPGLIPSIRYDAAGRPLRTDYASGANTTNVYDLHRGWLSSRYASVGPGPDQGRFGAWYTHDRRSGLIAEASISTSYLEERWRYSYDALYRLALADHQSDDSQDKGFTYDKGGPHGESVLASMDRFSGI